MATADHYRRLTEELNKCFDDIELFVRYLESLVEYTKELDRDVRRKDRKSSGSFSEGEKAWHSFEFSSRWFEKNGRRTSS